MIKTALVGLGYSGSTFHLPFLKRLHHYAISAVVSSKPALAETLVPGVPCVDTIEQLVQLDIELVIITSPNHLHYEQARQVLAAGMHVVLEKPFVTDVREGQALIELARRQRRVISVFHNRRWDADFLTVRQLLAQGRLGTLATFESHFDRFRPQPRDRWKESGGAGSGNLFDLGAHLFDQALVLFGEPESLTAQVKCLRPGANADDYFHVVLEYPALQVILHGSMLVASPSPRFAVHGRLGSYLKYGLDSQEGQLAQGECFDSDGWGEDVQNGVLYDPSGEAAPVVSEIGCYQAYYLQLADCIENGAPNPVSAGDALKVVRLIQLAHRSSQEGRTLPCQ